MFLETLKGLAIDACDSPASILPMTLFLAFLINLCMARFTCLTTWLLKTWVKTRDKLLDFHQKNKLFKSFKRKGIMQVSKLSILTFFQVPTWNTFHPRIYFWKYCYHLTFSGPVKMRERIGFSNPYFLPVKMWARIGFSNTYLA